MVESLLNYVGAKKLELVGIKPKKIEQSKPIQDLNRNKFPALYLLLAQSKKRK
jgi:hypothetical protein